MRTISVRAVLLALPLLAGCDVVESDGSYFPQPRHYSAPGPRVEGGYTFTFCSDGDVYYTLGGDIIEAGRYSRFGRDVILHGERGTHLVLTLSANGDTIRYPDAPPIVRHPEFEGGSCG